MPYISQDDRVALDPLIDALSAELTDASVGEFNYVITRLLKARFKPESYYVLNAGYGAVLAAAAEFYRTVVAPYEDGKREKNGDV